MTTTLKLNGYPDKEGIFKKVIARPENKVCFDCGKENPAKVDVWHGIFICDDCADFHDNTFHYLTCLTRPASFYDRFPLMLIMMNIGGNKRARDFFLRFGGWTDGGDLVENYISLAASLYRSKLVREALKIAMGFPASSPASESKHSTSDSELPDINVTEDALKECTLEDQNPETSPVNSSADLFGQDMIDQLTIQETDEARRRFPNAKSISSAEYFWEPLETDDTEAKDRLQEFANATAISSADLFKCSAKNPDLCEHEFCGLHQKQVEGDALLLEETIETCKKIVASVSSFFGGVRSTKCQSNTLILGE